MEAIINKDRLYSWLVPRVVYPAFEGLTGHRPWSEAGRLRKLQWRSREELEGRAVARLRHLLEHASENVPFWGELLSSAGVQPGDVQSLTDLRRVAITSKADLRASSDRAVAQELAAGRGNRVFLTSGSTGMPFRFLSDKADFDGWKASYIFFREWTGSPIWETTVAIVGTTQVNTNMRALANTAGWVSRLFTGEQVVALAGGEVSTDQLVSTLRRTSRKGAYRVRGYASYVTGAAAQLVQSGVELEVPPSVVVTGSDTLTHENARIIERAFRAPVVNKYSCWEVPHIAQTCPDNPELMHVNIERVVVRVVRDDGSDAAPGEEGRVLLTHLRNYVMPFINYEVGDRAVAGGPCPCGRGMPTLRSVEGRTVELIHTLSGKTISPGALSYFTPATSPQIESVWQYQAEQVAADRVVLRVVPAPSFSPHHAETLRSDLERLLGPGMNVSVEAVEEIPREPSGKRLIIKALRN